MLRSARTLALLLIYVVSGVTCNRAPVANAVEGFWENRAFRIDINKGAAVSEPRSIFTVTEKEWESKLGLKSIVTEFQPDGTYTSAHYDPADSLLFTASGLWVATADSLLFDQQAPRTARYTLAWIVRSDTLKFEGFLDWDGDGLADDYYTGYQFRRGR